jgi:hypothetical protein
MWKILAAVAVIPLAMAVYPAHHEQRAASAVAVPSLEDCEKMQIIEMTPDQLDWCEARAGLPRGWLRSAQEREEQRIRDGVTILRGDR